MNNINFNDMFSSFPKMSEMMNDMCKAFGSWDGNEDSITFTLKSGKTVKISEANDKVEVTVDGEQYHYTSDTKPKSNYCYTYTANNPPKPYTKEEKKEEEEKKPKHGHLEKLVDIPKIDDPNLFRNTIPTKVYVDKNLTTPLTLAHLDKYELKLTKLESKLEGRIEKLLIVVAVIGMMSLTTLFLLCTNS